MKLSSWGTQTSFPLHFWLDFRSLHPHRWPLPKTCRDETRPSESVSNKRMLNIRAITRTYVYKACMTNIGTAPVGCRGSVDVNCLEASAQLRVNEYTHLGFEPDRKSVVRERV